MIHEARTIPYEKERMWFYALVACLVVSVLSYMYFLSASVVHVVMRKEIDKEMSMLSSNVGELEARYIEVQHAVSEDIASLHGFTETDAKIYIDRSTTLTLSTP